MVDGLANHAELNDVLAKQTSNVFSNIIDNMICHSCELMASAPNHKAKPKRITDRLGLGTWSFGGRDWSHGWGEQTRGQSIEALIQAIDVGIRVIDTAAAYGLGVSESVVGQALSDRQDSACLVSTKCGQLWDSSKKRFFVDLKPSSIREEVEGSLRRLRLNKIDLIFIHYPSEVMDENFRALDELVVLQQKGKLSKIGLSNFSPDQILSISGKFPIHAVQSKYSLLDKRARKKVLSICSDLGLKFYAYQALESGLLTGSFHEYPERTLGSDDWRNRSNTFTPKSLRSVDGLMQRMKRIANRLDVSIANVALAWVLADSRVDIALVGARNARQSHDLSHLDLAKLDPQDISELEGCVDELTDAGLNPVL